VSPSTTPQAPPASATAPLTAIAVAERVRGAFDDGDLEQSAALFDPDVRWGAPGDPDPPCRNRRQVVRERAREPGRSAAVTEVEVHGHALLVGLALDDGHLRWPVLRVGPRGVEDIRGSENRSIALAAVAR
jgi:hypothetical protein